MLPDKPNRMRTINKIVCQKDKISVQALIVSSFPCSSDETWAGVKVTPVVIASTIHRTYGVRTSPDMVRMAVNQKSCEVELSSEADAARVFQLYGDGVVPSLHNKDSRVAPWRLSISVHHLQGQDQWTVDRLLPRNQLDSRSPDD